MVFARILIANNGMAAAKFLMSMKSAQSLTDSHKHTQFFGMVSDDDLRSNPTYIQHLDYIVQVPGGPSRNNYGNVDLIVDLARRYNCDAVWPGWGHASENYLLAQKLESLGIGWIGPDSETMIRLGDKVESLLQAHQVGVSCAPWSGAWVSTAKGCGIYSEAQALSVCDKIGYPVMIKASTGGGGKGIRRVDSRDECVAAYNQVCAEVSDGIIFAMKCIDDCRHVEIQIVGDGKGRCIALSGRDCSVQRRHQKLVEEGPPPQIPPKVLLAMQTSAERLCESVRYRNAGTVEFLYKAETSEFFFLEVNCRLQVEHPVTELLWGLNLPLIQVLIAAGSIPLAQIPGLEKFSDPAHRPVPDRHVVACRIVAEDPVNKWLPSSGDIYEIRTPPSSRYPDSLAYFGLSSSGSRIHQFADSQFGHVFVSGQDRAASILRLHEFLGELTVIGSVSTNIAFMTSAILNPSSEFAREGPPTTSWLDEHFASRSKNSITRIISFRNGNRAQANTSASIALVAVCTHFAMKSFWSAENEILKWVRRGHKAPHVPTSYSERLICPGGEKVSFETVRTGRSTLAVQLQNDPELFQPEIPPIEVSWVVSHSTGPAFTQAIMTLNGIATMPASVLVSIVSVSGTKARVQVGRNEPWHQFEIEEDKSKIFAPMNGRLVRWLVPNGATVSVGERVCELEAMKMITIVSSRSAGQLLIKILDGVSFIEGDILASLEDSRINRQTSGTPKASLNDSALSVVGDLVGIITQSTPVRPSSTVVFERCLDGFGAAGEWRSVLPSILKQGADEVSLLFSKFVQDEINCAKYIPHDSVGEDTVDVLQVIAEGSDEDLVAAWRHRGNLLIRSEMIAALLGSAPVESLALMVVSLTEATHKSLLASAARRLHKLSPGHPAFRSAALSRRIDDVASPQPEATGDAKLDRLREIAAEQGTFFIYDLPSMLEDGVRNLWTAASFPTPDQLLSVTHLVFDEKGIITEKPLESPVVRCCGMAAFMAVMKTPELPHGRRAIFIGNDITYQIGTFSVNEDKMYLKASELARSLGIPRIFVACNSGARLGLCSEVQKRFKVEWNNPSDISEGFKYLYLTDADYREVEGSVTASLLFHPIHGCIWIITDVIGKPEEYIGVENLAWSGAIAGESSKSYQETFTMTYVTGRTVGIGAYVSRLCQRIVQKIDSPILLTGFQALNKLIGSDVYKSNDEIGGVGVMFRNGVSHLTVKSDSEGIGAILNWLQFVPECRGAPLPVFQAIPDPIDRAPADADAGRSLVEGPNTLFDVGSFVEVQTAWARSVIVGRARLGGIPIGVIVVETRQTHYFQPADPADFHSQSVARPQAGQVWYPDSAYKTAQAIMDFNREGLPLMILANWRGFSGGQRDMFNEILKFGSFIVDALAEYKQPVFVYLPPKAELRGGAWVVVDSRINPEKIEMYADPTSRGGVLEPSGTTEIKFRNQSLFELMMRSDPQAQVLGSQGDPDAKTRIQEYFTSVKPTLVQIANTFADMHDTPTRMVKTGAIKAVVDWSRAREFFCYRLRYRMGLKQSAPCLGNSAPTQLGSDEYLRLLHESKGE